MHTHITQLLQAAQQLAQTAADALRANADYLQMYYDDDVGYLDITYEYIHRDDLGDDLYCAVMQRMHVLLDYDKLRTHKD